MGHIRLGVLPKHHRWKEVIGYLNDPEIPAFQAGRKILDNSKEALSNESVKSSLGYCVWYLANLTMAAKGSTFRKDLLVLNLSVDDNTNAIEFISQVADTTNDHLSNKASFSALNNIAGLALRESLAQTVGIQANTLFGSRLEQIQIALINYSSKEKFGSLMHTYFSNFLKRTLHFVIEKEISNHLGPGKRFNGLQNIKEYERALEVFAGQTSKIVKLFSGGWYSKKRWEKGEISEEDAVRFVHVALKKIREDIEKSVGEKWQK